jgi:hypothetical protein
MKRSGLFRRNGLARRCWLFSTGFLVLACSMAVWLLPSPAQADPQAFATASGSCGGQGGQTLSFPAPSSAHPNAIFSLTSTGGSSGIIEGEGVQQWQAGDTIWGSYGGGVDAGTTPTMDYDCDSGSSGGLTVSLYDEPSVPASFSGSLQYGSDTDLDFTVPGEGEYEAYAQLSQGTLTFGPSSDFFSTVPSEPVTLNSSGAVSLGALTAGSQDMGLSASDGPPAEYTITIQEVPPTISGLSFDKQYAKPGTLLTASYAINDAASMTATVVNSSSQVVRNLGTYSTSSGAQSLQWDGRSGNGANVPDGLYKLDLTATDVAGQTTTASATVVVDGTPPTVTRFSPFDLPHDQTLAFTASDALSGVHCLRVYVNGKTVRSTCANPGTRTQTFDIAPKGSGWPLGLNLWKVIAGDNAGNEATYTGTFVATGSIDCNGDGQSRHDVYFGELTARNMNCQAASDAMNGASIRRGHLVVPGWKCNESHVRRFRHGVAAGKATCRKTYRSMSLDWGN